MSSYAEAITHLLASPKNRARHGDDEYNIGTAGIERRGNLGHQISIAGLSDPLLMASDNWRLLGT